MDNPPQSIESRIDKLEDNLQKLAIGVLILGAILWAFLLCFIRFFI